MEFDALGSKIKTNPDGSLSVETAAGAAITMGDDGISINLEEIKSVGIKNVIDVEVHQINTIVGSRSHYIRFNGGGEVKFAYNQKGQLIEFSGKNVSLNLTPENELLFSQNNENKNS